MPARRVAVGLLHAVLANRQPLDEALVSSRAAREMVGLAERDRGLARAIASTALRRLGQIDDVLGTFLEKGVPKRSGPLRDILRAAVCQLLFLDMPAHAVIDLAVTQCKRDRNARHFDKLANAVLRRVDDRGRKLVAAQDAARLNTPEWLWARLIAAYGEDNTRRIAEAHLQQAPLDLSVKQNPDDWAKHLNGTALPTGSVRISHSGSIEKLKGFASGDWWVQDAAAALPAKLFGNVANKRIADLCAAPGGKTAQLAQAGAQVTAVDASEKRLERLAGNMDRLGLKVETVCADAGAWRGEQPFDAVLLDAPCTGTGTLRRHPDIAHLKSEQDLAELTRLQARLLRHATSLLQPGGMLVYCTCSLEREEGNDQITDLLSESPGMRRAPIESVEFNGPKSWITDEGDLRTLPFDLPADDTGMSGVDGFFAARLVMN
ncbi:MAG: methyltransferase domain-containing protein [Hyphomicrobiaceae bacterium]|nr:methyltransferase domain-containing protein [Hyphomicrobiaceae bacterium]